MILYGLKACDSCKKARKALGCAAFADVREDGVPAEVLERALVAFGDGLVNTRSMTWRGLSAEERAASPLDLLRAHPALMKRPLIVDGDAMWLGWGADVQSELVSRS